MQCLKQLYNDGYVIDKLAADHAAANGNIECAEYIAEKCTYVQEEWRHFSIASYSELRYFISIITKLRQNLSPPELTKFIKSNSHHVCRDAIKKNKPDILEYFIILCRSMDINIGNCCVYIACKCGNLECLKILTKYNYKSEQRLYEACISNGRLDMIEYLLNNDHVINEKDYLCDLAIQHNKPDIFAYFIKKGMRWSHKILIYAVVNDNHYIYEHITHGDYISDERMYNASCAAAYTGNLKYLIRILDKLQKNIPITKLQYKSMMHMAISKDRYECIKYLHKHAGCYIKGQRTRSMILDPDGIHMKLLIYYVKKQSCNSIDFCDHRCDTCFRENCSHEKDTINAFKKYALLCDNLYDDVIGEICSFISNKAT